jgi:hypothetical protein
MWKGMTKQIRPDPEAGAAARTSAGADTLVATAYLRARAGPAIGHDRTSVRSSSLSARTRRAK